MAVNRYLYTLLISACLLLAASARGAISPSELQTAENIAVSFMRGEPSAAYDYFGDALRTRYDLEKLAATRRGLLERGGGLRYIQAAYAMSPEQSTSLKQAAVPVDLTHFSLEIVLSWNGELQPGGLTGFAIRPMSQQRRDRVVDTLTFEFVEADYVDMTRFRTIPINAGTRDVQLTHRLTIPKLQLDDRSMMPGVVILPDRHMIDADGTVGIIKPMRDLANGLSSRGIATIRFPRRLAAYPELTQDTYDIEDELLLDAEIAVRLLVSQPQVDQERIYAVGFGTGGAMAPELARRLPGIRGIVMLSAPARIGPDRYVAQLEAEGVLDSALTQREISSLKGAVEYFRQGTVENKYRYFDTPASFFYSAEELKPAQAVQKLDRPVLLLFGGLDYRLTEEEYQKWGEASRNARNVTLRYFPTLNGWLMPARTGGTPQESSIPNHIAREVINQIGDFVE